MRALRDIISSSLRSLLPAFFLLVNVPAARAAAPGSITDLQVVSIVSTGLGASSMTVTLSWTAPDSGAGDPYPAGSGFLLRYSSTTPIIDDASFDGANFYLEIATDAIAPGSLQGWVLDYLAADASHYFVIKTTNSNPGELSGLSLSATAQSYIITLPDPGGDSTGVSWGDYDNDGDLDAAFSRWSGNQKLLTNNGDGTFTTSDLPGVIDGVDFAWGDWDNDGDLDLLSCTWNANNFEAILQNDGGGTFTRTYILDSKGSCSTGRWGDFDNDGDLDFVNQQGRILRNDGDIQFTSFSVTNSGNSLWADYDNDGDLDLVVSDGNILRNDGAETFTAVALGASGVPSVADCDGDGLLDIAIGGTLLKNNGGDSFSSSALPVTGYFAWGDYDNDGDYDMVSARNGDNVILRNDGSCSFDLITLKGSAYNTLGMSWGDYDGDGDLDLISANYSGGPEEIMRNDIVTAHTPPTPPNAGFSLTYTGYSEVSSSGTVILRWDAGADAETTDADLLNYYVRVGTMDVAGSSEILKIPARFSQDAQSGGGSFLYSTRLSDSQRGIRLEGLQKETTIHWAVVTEDSEFMRSAESTEQTASLVAPRPIADLSVVTVSTGIGASSTTARLAWTAPGDDNDSGVITGGEYEIRYSTIAVIDTTTAFVGAPVAFRITVATTVNPDDAQAYEIPFLDANTTYYFSVMTKDALGVRSGLSNPTTAPAQRVVFDSDGDTRGAAWGDYDGDGDLDFAAANNGNEFLFTNDGSGNFTKTEIAAGGINTMGLAWGDYDNDGDLDLALANSGAADQVLRNDGGGTFSLGESIPGTAGLTSRGIAWGDFDNDGDLDLAVAGDVFDAYVAVNNGAAGFSTFTVAGLGPGTGIAWGDYDADGDLDIGKSSGTEAAFARNDGNRNFNVFSVPGLGAAALGAAWGDFDKDGDLDLYVGVSGADDALFAQTGVDTFTKSDITGADDPGRGLAAADYDNDGDLDIAVAGPAGTDDQLRINDGAGGFSVLNINDTDSNGYGISWGDADGDGDLDLATAHDGGDDEAVIRNDLPVSNTAPGQPSSGLSASFAPYTAFASSGILTLQWDDVADDQTPAASMKYFVRVGTTVAGSSTTMKFPSVFGYDGYSGQSDEPWSTRLSASQRGIKLHVQAETTVYWAVVAEDGGMLRGSPSSEQTVFLAAPGPVADLTVAANTTIETSSSAWARLTFTAPGENGEASGTLPVGMVYDVRWATGGAIGDIEAYLNAPFQKNVSAAGDTAGASVNVDIPVEASYSAYFALTAVDQNGVRGPLSNGTGAFAPPALSESTTQTAYVNVAQGAIIPFLHLTLSAVNGDVTWEKVRVRREGSLPDQAIKRVSVLNDLNGDGTLDAGDKTATLSNAPAVFASSAVTLTLSAGGQTLSPGSPQKYFIAAEIDPKFLPVDASTIALLLDGEAVIVTGGGVRAVDFPAMVFDGADDSLRTGFHSDLNPSAVTVEAWVRTADAGTDRSIVTRGTAGTGYRLWLNGEAACGAGVPTFYVGATYLCANRGGTTVAVNDGQWHHVAGTYSAEKGKALFVDGLPLSTGPVGGTMNSPTAGLGAGGADPDGLGSPIDGQLDEIRISDFVRYSTTTAFLPARRFGSNNGEKVLYHFDTVATSVTITDASQAGGKNGSFIGESFPFTYGRSSFTTILDNQDVLYASGTDLTPNEMFRAQQDVPVLKLELWTGGDFVSLEELAVDRTGEGTAGGIQNIWLYLDDGDAAFEPGADTQLQKLNNFGGVNRGTFTLSAVGKTQLLGPTTKTYFIAWDVGQTADRAGGFGLAISSTSDFVIRGGTDTVSAQNIPIQTSTRPVLAAEANVVAETATGTWVNITSMVFVGNFGEDNVHYFHYEWDNSTDTNATGFSPYLWGAEGPAPMQVVNATQVATTDADDWYLHARAYDVNQVSGTLQHVGPFFVDRSIPVGSSFISFDGDGGTLSEGQPSDLAASVTVQYTVRDQTSGLNLDGPSPAATTDDTVTHYRFDEAVGTSVWEDGGPARNRLSVGASEPQKAAGRYGTGLLFYGTQNLQDASPAGLPVSAAPRTIEAWVRPLSTSGTHGIISWGTPGVGHMRLVIEDGQLGAGMGSGIVVVGPVLSTGVWQHVMFTYDGAVGRYYLDGVYRGQNSFGAVSTNLGTLYVGRTGLGDWFKGSIDEVRVLRRALSADEIVDEHDYGNPYYVSFSTNAGASWTVITDTAPLGGPFVYLGGVHGSSGTDRAMQAYGLELVASTTTATGNRGTNQVRFHAADLAGNVMTAGPFSIYVDTNTPIAISTPSLPGDGTFAGTEFDFYWTAAATSVVQGMGGAFQMQVSSGDPGFAFGNVLIDVSTPAIVNDEAVDVVTSLYMSTFTGVNALAEGATYYWRVRSQSSLGEFGPWSAIHTFVTDLTSPTGSAFVVYDSTGGAFGETTFIDRTSGITAALTVQDTVAGLGHPIPYAPHAEDLAYWGFDERDGAGARDVTGKGNDGTLSCNGAGCTPAGYALTPFGAGIDCGGPGNQRGMRVPNAGLDLPAFSSFTVSAWVNPSLVTGQRVIAALGGVTDGTNTNYVFRISNGALYLTNDTTGGPLSPNQLVRAGEWTHVAAISRPGSDASFYVDGRLAYNTGTSFANSGGASMDFTVCAGLTDSGNWEGIFSGLIDEVRVSSYAMTAREIAALYTRTRPGRFAVEYSTTAGQSWVVVSATSSAGGYPYVALDGSPGATDARTFSVHDLSLAGSTNTKTGAGATNQLRFLTGDRKGNYTLSGPFAVLTDTVAAAAASTPTLPMDGVYVSTVPQFSWTGPSTATFAKMGAAPIFLLEVDDDRGFGSPEIVISTPVHVVHADAVFTQGMYASTQTLADNSTFYWRVRARDSLGLYSQDLTVFSFVTDFSTPTGSSYAAFNSTGGLVTEGLALDLLNSVSAQLRIAHPGESGLAVSDVGGSTPYGVVYTTNGAGIATAPRDVDWNEGVWSYSFLDPGVDAEYVTAMAVFGGKLYAGTGPQGKVFEYDGTDWILSGTLAASTVTALVEFQGALYAGLYESDQVFRFNGLTWSSFHTFAGPMTIHDMKGYNGQLYAATSDAGRLWAYDAASGNWYVAYDSPSTELFSVEEFDSRLFVSGQPDVYMFDGAAWRVSYSKNAALNDLQTYDGKLYAASNDTGRIWLYDGEWSQDVDLASENIVEALGIHAGRLYASARQPAAVAVYMRDGKDWLRVRRLGDPQDRVNVFSSYGGRLYSGGHLPTNRAVVHVSTPIALTHSGIDGGAGPATLEAAGLDLVASANGAICAENPLCNQTNQIRFQYQNRAGRVGSAGPFSILADPLVTAPTPYFPGLGGWVRESQPPFSWVEGSTQPTHYVQVSDVPNFLSGLVVDEQTGNFTLTPLGTLADATTYYWHVRAQSANLLWTDYSANVSFATDLSVPSTAAYIHRNSTDGAFAEDQFNNLAQGVTVQLSVADLNSGVALRGAPRLLQAGSWHFEGGAGSTTIDVSQFRNHGNIVGPVSRVTGKAGKGLSIGSGGGAYVDISSVPFAAYTGVAMGVWVRPNSLNRSSATVWATKQGRLQYESAQGKVRFEYQPDAADSGGCALQTSADFNAQTWNHVVVSMDPPGTGENRLFVNGALADSCAGAGTPMDTFVRVGEDGVSGVGTGNPLDGRIDELRAYGVPLAAPEIDMEMRLPRFFVMYSTTAGSSWRAVESTSPVSAGFLSYGGTPANADLRAGGLDLTESTNTVVCGQASPCGATNQLHFFAADEAGNIRQAGPFAILVDTSVPAPQITSLTPLSTDTLYVTSTATDNLTGIDGYLFQASTDALFEKAVSSSGFIAASTYTFSGLASGSTYYVRLITRDQVLNFSTPTVVIGTATFADVAYSTTGLVVPPTAIQDGEVPMLGFWLRTNPGEPTFFDRIRVRRTGNCDDEDVERVRIYKDNGDGAFITADDTFLAEELLVSSAALVDLAGASVSQSLSVEKSTFFVVFKMAAGAGVGDTVGLEISSGSDVGLRHPAFAFGNFPTVTPPIPVQDGKNLVQVLANTTMSDYNGPADGKVAPGQANVPVLALRMNTDTGTSLVSSMVVTLSGTLNPNDIAAVTLWRDALPADGLFDADGDERLNSSFSPFSNNVSTLVFTQDPQVLLASRTISTSQRWYYLTVTMGGLAMQDTSFQLHLSSATDLILQNSSDTVSLAQTPITADTVTVILSNILSVSFEDVVPAAFIQGEEFSVIKATLTINEGTAQVNRFQVSRTGNGADSDIEWVHIRKDNGDGLLGNEATDPTLGSAAFVSDLATVNIATETLTWPTTAVYFVTYEMSPSANAGNMLGGKITNASRIGVANPATTVSGTFPFETGQAPVSETVNQLRITNSVFDVSGGGLKQGATHQAMLQLDLVSSGNEFDWYQLVVATTGTGSDADVGAVNLWHDTDRNGALDLGTDTMVTGGGDAFVSGLANLGLSLVITTYTQTYFVTLSMANDATPGSTIGVKLTSSSAFNLESPNTVSTHSLTFPISAGPVAIEQAHNTITITTASVVPGLGAEPGETNVGLLEMVVRTDISNANWLSLEVGQFGSASDVDVDAVKLYYDKFDNGVWEASNLGQYDLVTTAGQSFGDDGVGSVILDFATPPVISPAPKRYYLVVDISTSATPEKTVSARTLAFDVESPNVDPDVDFQTPNMNIKMPPETLYVVGLDSAPAQVSQSTTAVMLTLQAWMPRYSAYFNELTVTRTGTSDDDDIKAVSLYDDTDGNGLFSGADTRLDLTTFSGGVATLEFAASTITVSTQTYFVVYDLADTAEAGKTVGGRIDAAGEMRILAPHSPDTGAFPIQSGNSTIIPTATGLFVSARNLAPGKLTQEAADQVLLNLAVRTTGQALIWRELVIRSSGTMTDSDIAAIHLWRDTDKSDSVTAGDIKLTSGTVKTFLNGSATLNISTRVATTEEWYLITVDVAPFAQPGRSFWVVLESSASFTVTAPNFVVNSGFPLESDRNVTFDKLPEDLFVTLTDLVDSGLNQGTLGAMVKLEVRAERNQVEWTELNVEQKGSLPGAEFTAVRLYRDLDGSGDFDVAVDTEIVGSGSFSGGMAELAFSTKQVVNPSTSTFFLVVQPSLSDAAIGATIVLDIETADLVVLGKDSVALSMSPFTTAANIVLDAKTPSQPAVLLADGRFSSNFEYLQFDWSSSVATGSIIAAYYAVGTTPYDPNVAGSGEDVVPFTALSITQADSISQVERAKGFALLSGTTYYVAVKVESSTMPAAVSSAPKYTSPVGISTHGVLMDFDTPPAPSPVVSPGASAVLISWNAVPGGVSGILGYLIEYRTGASPLWINAKSGAQSTAGLQLRSLPLSAAASRTRGGGPLRTLAVSPADIVAGTSYQASGLPSGTIFVRVRAVSGSGVVSNSSEITKVQLGALPSEGIGDASSYPNPFDSRQRSANIHYTLSSNTETSINLYSVFGRKIKTMSFSGGSTGGLAGSNTVQWDGTDDAGRKVSKGIYLAVIESGGAKKILKIGVIH